MKSKRSIKQKSKKSVSGFQLKIAPTDIEELPTLSGKKLTDASIIDDMTQKAAKGELAIKQKRTKERTIADIIEKVSTWRKLYNGIMVPDENNNGEH
jgi:hypothetical protein